MNSSEDIARGVIKILYKYQFSPEDEKKLQEQIKAVFEKLRVRFEKEFHLDKSNCIDFLINGGVGLEVKIQGSKNEIYKQCERYCKFDSIKTLILVTTKSMGMLSEIEGKPVYLLNLNRAWL